jgi:hypothetical protein
LDVTIVFLEQHGNRISLLVWFTKHRQLAHQVGDNRTLSIIEKEAMAPRTTGGLEGGMARGGHIHRKNYEFIDANGLAPASTISHSLDLHHGNLNSMAHYEHTPRTALGGYILKFTYPEGPVPSLVAIHG